MALGSRGCSRGVEWPDLKGKMKDGDDAQDIQEPEGPKTEVLEVLAVLVDRRLAGADPQGGRKVGLKDRPLSCLVSRLVVSSDLGGRARGKGRKFVSFQTEFR